MIRRHSNAMLTKNYIAHLRHQGDLVMLFTMKHNSFSHYTFWLGARSVPSHYLKQWQLRLMPQFCVIVQK